jgi:hypothetical protein
LNTEVNNLMKIASVAILTGKTKNAITALGLPSYISGAHNWHGKAANLKNKPNRTVVTPTFINAKSNQAFWLALSNKIHDMLQKILVWTHV